MRIITALLLVCLIGGCANQSLDLVFPYKWKGIIDKGKVVEPSGIVYHAARDSLFVVGDEGALYELKPDGSLVRESVIEAGADFEGVTVDPATGRVYIVVEDTNRIYEIDPDAMQVLRRFTVPRTWQERTVMKAGGQGLEAITFIPDASHTEGGVFVVANQAFGLDDAEDVSALVEVELPLCSGAGEELTGRVTGHWPLNIIDLSGLHYDALTGDVMVAADADNVLLQVTRDGRIVRSWAFPGNDQEGITADHAGHLYIAQDSGGVMKVQWKR